MIQLIDLLQNQSSQGGSVEVEINECAIGFCAGDKIVGRELRRFL